METIVQLGELEARITKEPAILVYFSQPQCGVCTVLKPKLEAGVQQYYPNLKQIYVNISQSPEIAGQMHVFTVPVVLVFFEGKEAFRYTRNVNVNTVLQQLERSYRLLFG
jgi:thioredoxin 1